MTALENDALGIRDMMERPDRASLELLYEVGREVAADLDLRTVLHRVLFLSMKNVGAIAVVLSSWMMASSQLSRLF